MALKKDPSPGGPTTDGTTIYTDQHNEIIDRVGGEADLTANRALATDANGDIEVQTTTKTEIGYVNGVTSAIQTQIDAKAASSHTHPVSDITISGTPDGTKFLRDDDSWQALPGGGDAVIANGLGQFQVSDVLTAGSNSISNIRRLHLLKDTRTLVSGIVTPINRNTVVAAESGTADNLDGIDTTDATDATIYYLWADTGDTITLRHNQTVGGGQAKFNTPTGANITLSENYPTIVQLKSTIFYVIGGYPDFVPDASFKIVGTDPLNLIKFDLSSLGSAERTWTFPDKTSTFVGHDTTATLTNKTFDANGTGNSISNIDTADHSATGTPSADTYYRGDNTWADFDADVQTSRLDQMAVPTADLVINAKKITGVADPTLAQDAVTKAYFEAQTTEIPAFATNANKHLAVNSGETALEYVAAGSGDALVANKLDQFASTTSLELKNTISDETGSGALVFATSPTLVTPILGTPTSGALTNCTSIPAGQLTGSIADARLSANVPLLDAENTFAITSAAMTQTLQSDGTTNLTLQTGHGTTGSPVVLFKRSRGTVASPTAVQTDDNLGGLSFQGHDGTAFGGAGTVLSEPSENWSVGNHGSHLDFYVVPIGSTTNTLSLRIENDGDVDWPQGGVHTNFVIDESGTGNSIKTTRYMQAVVFDFTTDTATGDGKYYAHIPPEMDGMNLVYAHAEVITAGTTGTMKIMIHNVDNALDMLSGTAEQMLTIDTAETGSETAATGVTILGANDHVNTNDVIRIDVDAVHTTPAKGLIVTMGFKLP